tara:strand:+ start:482 stop:1099 length:618 start_codon:yes stop_codon:yes gene_type:complete
MATLIIPPLKGVRAFGKYTPPTKRGAYKVRIVSTNMGETQSGAGRFYFDTMVLEGSDPDAKGCDINDGLNTITDSSDGGAGAWVAFLGSAGLLAKAEKGIKTDSDKFVGKVLYCWYEPKAQDGGGRKTYDSKTWVTEDRYKQLLAMETQTDDGDIDVDDEPAPVAAKPAAKKRKKAKAKAAEPALPAMPEMEADDADDLLDDLDL